MYTIRRVAKAKPGKVWEVANQLSKICRAYEEQGRNKAQVYIGGWGLPGEGDTVYAEWTQESIEAIQFSKVPNSVFTDHDKMATMMTDYTIEFYEMVTPEKLHERGLS